MGVDLISRGVDYGSARQIRSFWSPDISGFSKLSKLQSIQQYVKLSQLCGFFECTEDNDMKQRPAFLRWGP